MGLLNQWNITWNYILLNLSSLILRLTYYLCCPFERNSVFKKCSDQLFSGRPEVIRLKRGVVCKLPVYAIFIFLEKFSHYWKYSYFYFKILFGFHFAWFLFCLLKYNITVRMSDISIFELDDLLSSTCTKKHEWKTSKANFIGHL